MSSFGYNVLGFGANANSVVLPSEDEFNRVSFLSHFDGANNGVNNAFDDGSASNHTITANGNVTQGSFGPFAREEGYWGVKFDGNDYLDANDGVTFGSGNFTIEMFANFTTGAANCIFFGGRPTGVAGDYPVLIFISSDSSLQYNVGGSAITGGTITLNTWHHIAICRSSSSTKMFLDGTQIGNTYSDSTTYVDGGRMRLGNSGYNAGGGINGFLSNVRVVNAAIYTSNFTVPTSPLTAVTNTKLLACQSNRFVDKSASPLTLTPTGDTAVTAFGPFLTSEVYDAAVNGASAYFDGGDAFLTVSDSADLTPGNTFTFDAWIYPQVLNNYNTIMSQDGSTGYYWSILANGTLQFYTGGGGGSGGTHNSASGVVQLNQWNHVAYSVSGGTGYHFVNGVRSGSSHSNDIPNIAENLLVGVQKVSSFDLYGYGTDFRLVVGTALYTGSTYTVPTAPLTAVTNTKLLLSMADGQAIDSAAQNNLTLTDDVKLSTAKAKFGDTSMLFDGSGRAYIEGSNVLDFGAGDFTVEMFVNVTAFSSSYPTLLDARNSNDVEGPIFTLFLNDDDKFAYFANNTTQITAGSAASANTWYHVAVCRSGTSTKLFIDGTQAGNTYSDSTVYTQPNDRCILGGYYDSADYDFNGYIDEVRISKMARYTSNFTAPAEPFADKGQE